MSDNSDWTDTAQPDDGTYRDSFDWDEAKIWPAFLCMWAAAATAVVGPDGIFENLNVQNEISDIVFFASSTWYFLVGILPFVFTYTLLRSDLEPGYSYIFAPLNKVFLKKLTKPTVFRMSFYYSALLLAFSFIIDFFNTFRMDDPFDDDFLMPVFYIIYLAALTIAYFTEFTRRKDVMPIWLRLCDGLGSGILCLPGFYSIYMVITHGWPRRSIVVQLFVLFLMLFPVAGILGIFGSISTNLSDRFYRTRYISVIVCALIFPFIGLLILMWENQQILTVGRIGYTWAFLFVIVAWTGAWLARAKQRERIQYDGRVTSEAEEDGWE